MEEKKDIYKLWIQYTTKNDEKYFRQFVIGFNKIWKIQLKLDFINFKNSNDIESNGPKLNYLPDELLPAITKFIIIARDEIERGEDYSTEKLNEISDLIECLVIICRHFDNIETIIKYEYLGNLIAILTKIFQLICSTNKCTSEYELIFINFSRFLEVIYDPYFTWHNFLNGIFADYNKLMYKCQTINVEIIPFIYDCFQNDKMFNFPTIGIALLNALASIISGSQRNGMIGICPATVSIVMGIHSKWQCSHELRNISLKCCALMIIVLQRSSPEERQIELITIIKQYCDCLLDLLKTDDFLKNKNDISFEICCDDDNNISPIDVNALQTTILNIENFLCEHSSRNVIANVIIETNLIDILISIPSKIKDWNINQHNICSCVIKIISVLTKISPNVIEHLRNSNKFTKIFTNLNELGKPSRQILEICFELTFDNDLQILILPEVLNKLIEWLPNIDKHEQNYLSGILLKGCANNFVCKIIACEYNVLKICAEVLLNYDNLDEECMFNLIKLIEELAKINITPIELNKILWLLREETKFPHFKKLLQSIVTVALKTSNNGNVFSEYLCIRNQEDGLIVPDIKNWIVSGSFGFIFHCFIRLDTTPIIDENTMEKKFYRRMLFKLITASDTGYEIFIQNNSNLVVATITRREYLTSSVSAKILFDNNWHFVTVAITPPKRPFSYSQINVYIDFMQKLSTTLKVQGVNEPFVLCAIGSSFQMPNKGAEAKKSDDKLTRTISHESTSKGMFPSFLERTLSANVSNYFTLPLRNTTSFDPNVKNFPIGMQDTVFGEPACLNGQICSVLLADPITNLKSIFDSGANFASIFSQDNEQLDLSAKFIFCYAAAAYANGNCLDLVPGGKYNAFVIAEHCKTVQLQDTIHKIGGIEAILPILNNIIEKNESTWNLDSMNIDPSVKTPTKVESEFSDWEVLSSTSSYAEWKMIQHPVASFFCLLRFLLHDHEKNQENLLNAHCLPIIGSMLVKCNSNCFDVNCLMSIHLFIESLQNQKQLQSANSDLIDTLHTEIVFNFDIWSKMEFQITLGHIQYLTTMIKNDRKYFRKKFGILYFLDIIRQYYIIPDNLTEDDGITMRSTLLNIIRNYLQKDVNIKEINCIISFIASVKYESVLIEILEMLTLHIKGKNCKDQMILLLHEPHTLNLLYNLFIDKIYSIKIQEAAIRIIDCVLSTTRVQSKYKQVLRLHESDTQSLYPGLFSYLPSPMTLTPIVSSIIIDKILIPESDYCGLLHLVHQMSLNTIREKLEIARKLFQAIFSKMNSASMMAKQVGWQESIGRLLIRKPIANVKPDDERRKSFGININDCLLEDNTEFLAQSDLINFCEQSIENNLQNDNKDATVLLDEFQASVTEAANVIENEIKELAGSVTDVVTENVGNIFSVIRQRTSEIQESFESLAMGTAAEFDLLSTRTRTSSNSSEDQSSSQSTATISKRKGSTEDNNLSNDDNVDTEEQLIYLVTNILFTVLWRGVNNESPDCWKERGQVLACINLLGLNNELLSSHLTLKLHILEMGVQASLVDLAENANQTLVNQENAYQLLRMVYDLVVLGSNEDDSKKCSTKLLDGVLALFDCLMVFQQGLEDWSEMIRLCLGLLLKCSNNPDPGVVAMATAKLHSILQSRNSDQPTEMAYLLFSINKALDNAIEVGNPEHYSFLMPVMKALLEKCKGLFNLETNLPDLPPTTSGPVFFNDFQMYSTSKRWKNFVDKMIKPLYDEYQKEIELTLWEPINRFWAECYEGCKLASKKRGNLQAENRRLFQQKIVMPWKVKQVEEMGRLNSNAIQTRTKKNVIEKKWKSAKRFLYGSRGPWCAGQEKEEYWKLSKHENTARMRLKLEPELYPNKHETAAHLRDNATNIHETRPISSDLNTTIKSAVVSDFLTEDENSLLEEELRNNLEAQHQDVPLEKAVIIQECELITLMSKVKGRIEVNQSIFAFTDISQATDDGEKYDFRFSISKLREVHLRKYNLRRSALEIFLIDQTSYFLNFTTKIRNKIFMKILSLQPPNILYGSGRSPSELLKSSGLTQKWINREISNFEYLMYLNTIAGRSYNDLSQYPIFPWILADYTSEVLDLSDAKSFRDLSKPIGVINPKNEAEVKAKYDGFEDPSGTIPKFHYGTHYSNSAGVLHYLLRVEPFTSLHIELQSGRFDVADRQFHSIPQTWKLLMDNPNDVKELIPEFFYFPEFLRNMNKFDLGQLQITKEKVDDVILPKWATTPEQFIEIHRRALESEYVTQNIHNWIDLIFGYKQKGPKAVEALNVFYYCSYEGAVDLDKIANQIEREAVEGMINNFGQIPSQLLREPHPRRLTLEETVLKLLRLELKRPDLTHFLDRIVQINCELSTPKDPIIFLSVPRSPPRSFLQLSPDILVSVSKSSILGCNSWMAFDKEKGFLLEIDATTTNLKNRKRIFGPFHPSINLNSQLFAVSIDGKYLYVGGIWDNSLRVYNVNKGKLISSVIHHFDLITCISLDNCGSYLVTGAKDCTCVVWSLSSNDSEININNQQSINTSHTPRHFKTLYGHDDIINSVAIYTELDLVVSGSKDGTVNVYSIQDGQFIRTLKPIGCTESFVEISFVTISYQGHIAFSALDDTSHSVHVFNINGTNLGSKYVSGRVTGLTTVTDFLVVADDAGDVTMSRLYGLKPIFDIPLHVPIQTIVVTQNNTHLLAPLRDGRLAVIGVSIPTNKAKHSILNV